MRGWGTGRRSVDYPPAGKLIAAVGVAPKASLAEIRTVADEVVCLETPLWFFGVDEFFGDFRQVDDREVIEILQAAASRELAKS